MVKNLIFLVLVTCCVSCKKTPGEGGNAQIKGTYWVRNYDPFFSFVQGRYPAVNTTVYVFFGDDASPGANTKTNDKGEFSFPYLRKGKYRIVAYSKQQATATTPGEYAVEKTVTITKRKQVVDIGLDTLNQ